MVKETVHEPQVSDEMFKSVYITAKDEREAEKIAITLVKERLAACVNIFPIKSIYRWKGEIQREKEVAMLVKTKDKLINKIIKRVKELHSYKVPCIVSLPIEKGYTEFLKWIDESTK